MTLTFKKHDLEKNEKKKKLTNEQAKSSSLMTTYQFNNH